MRAIEFGHVWHAWLTKECVRSLFLRNEVRVRFDQDRADHTDIDEDDRETDRNITGKAFDRAHDCHDTEKHEQMHVDGGQLQALIELLQRLFANKGQQCIVKQDAEANDQEDDDQHSREGRLHLREDLEQRILVPSVPGSGSTRR